MDSAISDACFLLLHVDDDDDYDDDDEIKAVSVVLEIFISSRVKALEEGAEELVK